MAEHSDESAPPDVAAFRESLAEGLVAGGISEQGNPAQRDASHIIGWLINEGYRLPHIARRETSDGR